MNTTATLHVVTASAVPEDKRLDFLPAFFGPSLMLYGEALVYKWMGRLSRHYSGGLWQFHTLSNGGRYMAPTTPERLRITVAGNEFDGELSADAAGIVATLFALGQLAATEADDTRDQFVYLFHWLREYAAEHAEARLIFRAID
ncbi:antirestriction protein [Xanthomonas oryzae]|uniref:antirestriction protein n=1 Tax=Xanthomonas oryzae TaxID=347 RepID=UPI000CA08A59|nr:antirestriction protein [Xanthomonas oryzae]AZK89887.1 antirestriction protein [Xanthomonas oryzae pv. oryzae]PNR84149.1 antirestriction protein [Xanthomonas oryzae pv. oryzae]